MLFYSCLVVYSNRFVRVFVVISIYDFGVVVEDFCISPDVYLR